MKKLLISTMIAALATAGLLSERNEVEAAPLDPLAQANIDALNQKDRLAGPLILCVGDLGTCAVMCKNCGSVFTSGTAGLSYAAFGKCPVCGNLLEESIAY